MTLLQVYINDHASDPLMYKKKTHKSVRHYWVPTEEFC